MRLPKTPIATQVESRGVPLVLSGEWMVPARFDRPESEDAVLREAVGLVDLGMLGVLELRGTDRASFLHNLLSNHITRLTAGEGCFACLLNAKGQVEADGVVAASAECHWLITQRRLVPQLVSTFERYHFTEDVSIADATARWTVLALSGPRTDDAARALGLPVPPAPLWTHAHGPISKELPVHGFRTVLTGYPTLSMLVPLAEAKHCWDRWIAEGAPVGLRPVGWEAVNVLRVEAGLPWYGVDVDATHLLNEVEFYLAHALSESKGCYLGQEVVHRVQAQGQVAKRLVGLALEPTSVLPSAGTPLTHEGTEVGILTSVAISPHAQAPLALGYVARRAWAPGTRLTIATTPPLAAIVSPLPFRPPSV